jgi:hypothetical protein
MNKVIIITVIMLSNAIGSYGQWYYDKYFVHDINMLTKEQMDESIKKTKYDMIVAGCVAVGGGLLIWAGDETLKNGLPEDATIIEEIFGAKFMGKTYIILGIGAIAGGTIATICCFGRFEKIRSAIKNNYGPTGSLKISPAVVLYGNTPSATVGMLVRYRF